MRNPWGKTEWNGDWSDESANWSSISSKIKEKLELKTGNDGDFWMSYEDWLANFDTCEICNLTPDSHGEITEKGWKNKRDLSVGNTNTKQISGFYLNLFCFMKSIFSTWQSQMFYGKWIENETAGGRGYPDMGKFWTNPQFTFIINKEDILNDKTFVIVALMQKVGSVDSSGEKKLNSIHFQLYKVKFFFFFHPKWLKYRYLVNSK